MEAGFHQWIKNKKVIVTFYLTIVIVFLVTEFTSHKYDLFLS